MCDSHTVHTMCNLTMYTQTIIMNSNRGELVGLERQARGQETLGMSDTCIHVHTCLYNAYTSLILSVFGITCTLYCMVSLRM